MLGVDTIRERLQTHAAELDHFLTLIPSKLYIAQSDDPDHYNTKYYKNKHVSPEKQSLARHKAKRAKLDPDNQKSVVELQELQAAAQQQPPRNRASDSGIEEDEDEELSEGMESPGKQHDTVSIDQGQTALGTTANNELPIPFQDTSISDLKLKLQRRIAQLRSKRNAPAHNAASSVEINETRITRKRKRDEMSKKRQHAKANGAVEKPLIETPRFGRQAKKPLGSEGSKGETAMVESSEMRFGKLNFGDGAKPKKGTKKAAVALQQVQAVKDAMQQLIEQDPAKAKEFKEKESWSRALAMADGATVKDDPKLLKKTLKRQEQKKKRSEKQWADRAKTVQEGIATRQEKRAENIKAKAEERKGNKPGDKKKKKQRPGFEGSIGKGKKK